MKLTLNKDFKEALTRTLALKTYLNFDEGRTAVGEDDLFHRSIGDRDELNEVLMPFISQLCAAGVLTFMIDIDGITDIEHYSSLFGEPVAVFENGNIWIKCKYSGGGGRGGKCGENDNRSCSRQHSLHGCPGQG